MRKIKLLKRKTQVSKIDILNQGYNSNFKAMKKEIAFFAILTSIIFLSCDKKLYFDCANHKDGLQKINDSLTTENNLVTNYNKFLQNKHDSLNQINSNLVVINIKDKSENAALKIQADNELTQVNNAIIIYFRRIAQIAKSNTPPCINAANGFMRQWIAETDNDGGAGVDWKNKPVNHLANPKITLSTKEASQLYAIFTTFSTANQAAFINNRNYPLPHNGCCGTGGIALGHFLPGSINDLINLGNDIVDIVGSSGTDVYSWASTANDIRGIVNNINNLGVCDRGGEANANGVIARDVHAASDNTLHKILTIHLDNTNTPRFVNMITTFKNGMTELNKVRSEGYNPWLTPDWQIEYYTIMEATGDKLAVY
jgi:hypothetical protein